MKDKMIYEDDPELARQLEVEEEVERKPKQPVATPISPDIKMIRSTNAGVFYGRVIKMKGDTVTLRGARRLWYWDGAATLSELATYGTSKPDKCKFPVATRGDHIVLGVCEIIPMTWTAIASLDAVPIWTER